MRNVFTSMSKIYSTRTHPLLKQKKVKSEGLSVTSNYFQLNSIVQVERISVDFTTILHREDDGHVMFLKRNRGVL